MVILWCIRTAIVKWFRMTEFAFLTHRRIAVAFVFILFSIIFFFLLRFFHFPWNYVLGKVSFLTIILTCTDVHRFFFFFFFLGKWRIRALRNCRLEEQKLFPFDRKQYPWNTSLSFGKENSKHMANVTFSHYVNFAYSWLLSSSSLKSNIHNIRATNTP